MRRIIERAGWIVCVAALTCHASAARAELLDVTSASEVCAPDADPCVIVERVRLAPGAFLDFGARAVSIEDGGKLELGSGASATLECGDFATTVSDDEVLLLGDRPLDSNGGAGLTIRTYSRCDDDPTVPCQSDFQCATTCAVGGGKVDIDGVVNAGGYLGVGGSFLSIDAMGDAIVRGAVNFGGRHSENDGGSVVVTSRAGDVEILAPITSRAAGDATGGFVDAYAQTGNVIVDAPIDVRGGGGDGGFVDLYAPTGTLFVAADILASSTAGEGYGGDVSLEADAGVTVAPGVRIVARGHRADEGRAGYGGAGGRIDLISRMGSISVGPNVDILIDGARPDGFGGELYFDAFDDLSFSGKLLARGRGRFSTGGVVEMYAGDALTIEPDARIDVRNVGDTTGDVYLDGERSLTVGGRIRGGTRRGDEEAAIIDLYSNGTSTISGRIDNRGSADSTSAASTTIWGCNIVIAAGARIASRARGDGVELRALSGVLVAAGARIDARPRDDSFIRIRYHDPADPPVLDGTLRPDPELVLVPGLAACP